MDMPFTRIKIEKEDRNLLSICMCIRQQSVYMSVYTVHAVARTKTSREQSRYRRNVEYVWCVERGTREYCLWAHSMSCFCLIASLRPRTQIYLVRFMLTQSTHLSDCQDIGPMILSCCICTCIRMVRFSQFKTILILLKLKTKTLYYEQQYQHHVHRILCAIHHH